MRERLNKSELQEIILKTVAAAGILTVALLAPNALQMFKLFGVKPRRNHQKSLNLSRERMIKAGLLEYKKGFLRLSKKGEERLQKFEVKNYEIPKPRKWDKRWRILTFDIPEKRKGLRAKVRLTLTRMGFVRLQNSVWVYPYDCEDFITLLKADLKIGKDILYITANTIENDRWLLRHFGLDR